MNEHKLYYFLQKQILLLVIWSLFTGLGYTLLCVMLDVAPLTVVWYVGILGVSLWGWKLYHRFKRLTLNKKSLNNWYNQVKIFVYTIFGLWTILFLLYSDITEHNLNQVTVLIQIILSIMAATFLFSDKKLFIPIILIVVYPLIVYFVNLNEIKGYFLAIFTLGFLGFLLYSSNSGYKFLQQIFYQAQRDPLTGLYNRRFFMEHLTQVLKNLQQNNKFSYILLIDLDYFKTINDSLGHNVGDILLCEVSDRLKSYCGDSHIISRLGGDEFMIMSDTYKNEELCKKDLEIKSQEISRLLKETYIIDYNHIHISASIGVKLLDGSTKKPIDVIKETDIAMYEVKSRGRDGVINYNTVMSKQIDNTLAMERKLYFALEYDEIELHYQAQVDKNKTIVGCEVLARWYNPDLGQVQPLEFIKIAEKTGIIIELGKHILEESFKTLTEWDKSENNLKQFSINISVRQLLDESFVGSVESLVDKYLNEKLQKKVIFEITETLLAEDIERIILVMKKIKKLGIRFSLDDFGTGYSSLNYLREIPIDELKIDQSFIQNLGKNKTDEMMLKTIFILAGIFDLRVVSEGIENKMQFDILNRYESDLFQGFYFAKPVKKEDFETLLLNQKVEKINKQMHDKKVS